MRAFLSVLLISTLTLTACGSVRDSRLNPFNWFGKSRSAPVAESSDVNPLIPRQQRSVFRRPEEAYMGTPVDQITDLVVERTPGGAVLRINALPLRQGAFDVRVVPENDGQAVDGVLTFTLKALQPPTEPQGTESSRFMTAAYFVSDQDLLGVRQIRVQGARNAQVSRR